MLLQQLNLSRRILWACEFELDALDTEELVEARHKLRSHGVELRAPVGVGNFDQQGLLLNGNDAGFFRHGASGGKVPCGLGELLRRQALQCLRHDALQRAGNLLHRSIIAENKCGEENRRGGATCNLPERGFFRTPWGMELHLTPDQQAFVRQAIQSGRLQREEDAVQEALALWEERERARAEILAAVDEAEASLGRGEGRVITEQSMRELADEVKQQGRKRLAAEQPPTR